MSELAIEDNHLISKGEFSCIADLTKSILNKTLEQLEWEGLFIFPELLKNAEDLTKYQVILQETKDYYRTGNVMGFLGLADQRLSIRSRFCNQNDFFFKYLLFKVMHLPNIVDLGIDADLNERVFNYLLFLFPYYLRRAIRKGLYKQYVRNEYNDGNFKGCADISRHIKENTPFLGNIAYSKREFSYDNYLMELVRHTVEFIKSKPYGCRLLCRVKNDVRQIVESTPRYKLFDRQKIIHFNDKNPIRHPYFLEYRALQCLCLKILRYQKHQIGSGKQHIYGILFDGSWMWEEYISILLDNHFYHPMNRTHKGGQWLFGGDDNLGLIYPDFISRNSANRIIADAKYKPVDNIGNKDYLQLLAYMFRFESLKGYYIYPESGDCDILSLQLNKGLIYYEDTLQTRDDIKVFKFPLKIPADAVSYEDFVSKIKDSENLFLSELLKTISNSAH